MLCQAQGLHELSRESSYQSLSMELSFDDASTHGSAPELGSHEVSLASLSAKDPSTHSTSLSSQDASQASDGKPMSLIRVLAGGMLLPSEFRDEGCLQHASGKRQPLPRSVARASTLPPWPTRRPNHWPPSGVDHARRPAGSPTAQQSGAALKDGGGRNTALAADYSRPQLSSAAPPLSRSARSSSSRFSLKKVGSILASLHRRGTPWKPTRRSTNSISSGQSQG